jgi:hypothetical protein
MPPPFTLMSAPAPRRHISRLHATRRKVPRRLRTQSRVRDRRRFCFIVPSPEKGYEVSCPAPSRACHTPGPQSADDLVIGIALTTTWMLITGRRLRSGVPLVHHLTAVELIDFWADDHINPTPDVPSGLREQARDDSHDLHSAATGRRVA